MKKSLKVLFFGNEDLATGVVARPIILEALTKSPHELVGLVVHASDTVSRSKLKEPVIEYAEQNHIPILNPVKLADSAAAIMKLGADVGVLVAYGKIIPRVIIDLFPLGIINLHPSMLPMLRGSTPLETTILEGCNHTGVTIMKLVRQMDAGPILAQEGISISASITKQDLYEKLHKIGMELMLKTLDDLAAGQAIEKLQDESNATYCSTVKKSDGLIDFNKPAIYIERQVRAYSGWPSSYFENNGQRFVVNSAETTNNKIAETPGTVVVGKKTLSVQTSEGVVWITSIQPAGKKVMSIQSFLNGYATRVAEFRQL